MNERLAQYSRDAVARNKEISSSPKERNWTKAFFELYGDLPLPERQARSFAYALVNEPVRLAPLERLVGQIYQVRPGSGSVECGCDADSRWQEFEPRLSRFQAGCRARRPIEGRVGWAHPEVQRGSPVGSTAGSLSDGAVSTGHGLRGRGRFDCVGADRIPAGSAG